MSVSLTTTETSHLGTGSAATAYTIPFGWGSDSELAFTVTAADGTTSTPEASAIVKTGAEAGTVAFTAAIAATATLTIRRTTARTQTASFETAAPLSPTSLEATLDRMIRALQEVEARALRLSEQADALTALANGLVGFDSEGAATVLSPQAVFGTVIPLTDGSPIITSADASLTLTSAHHGRLIRLTSDSNIAITVPAGLPENFLCYIWNTGAGLTTVTPASGVTMEPDSVIVPDSYYLVTILGTGTEDELFAIV